MRKLLLLLPLLLLFACGDTTEEQSETSTDSTATALSAPKKLAPPKLGQTQSDSELAIQYKAPEGWAEPAPALKSHVTQTVLRSSGSLPLEMKHIYIDSVTNAIFSIAEGPQLSEADLKAISQDYKTLFNAHKMWTETQREEFEEAGYAVQKFTLQNSQMILEKYFLQKESQRLMFDYVIPKAYQHQVQTSVTASLKSIESL